MMNNPNDDDGGDAECQGCHEWFGFHWSECDTDCDGEESYPVAPTLCAPCFEGAA